MKLNTKVWSQLKTFDPRGSTCPICKQEFRYCAHTVEQVKIALLRRLWKK